MEKAYSKIALFFIAVAFVIIAGFYNTYFIYFPDFDKFKVFHHLHAILMVLWLLVLIVQPILINRSKYKWHKTIGKLTYILMPLIIISMLVAYRYSFTISVADNGVDDTISLHILFLPFTDVLPFTIFYLLAIFNRKKVSNHLRYMTSTAIIILSAGVFRAFVIWMGLDFIQALFASIIVMALTFIGFIFYDFREKRITMSNPFVIALIIFSIPNLLLLIVPYLSWWQTLARSLIN